MDQPLWHRLGTPTRQTELLAMAMRTPPFQKLFGQHWHIYSLMPRTRGRPLTPQDTSVLIRPGSDEWTLVALEGAKPMGLLRMATVGSTDGNTFSYSLSCLAGTVVPDGGNLQGPSPVASRRTVWISCPDSTGPHRWGRHHQAEGGKPPQESTCSSKQIKVFPTAPQGLLPRDNQHQRGDKTLPETRSLRTTRPTVALPALLGAGR